MWLRMVIVSAFEEGGAERMGREESLRLVRCSRIESVVDDLIIGL